MIPIYMTFSNDKFIKTESRLVFCYGLGGCDCKGVARRKPLWWWDSSVLFAIGYRNLCRWYIVYTHCTNVKFLVWILEFNYVRYKLNEVYKNPSVLSLQISYESIIISKCKVKKLYTFINDYIKWSKCYANYKTKITWLDFCFFKPKLVYKGYFKNIKIQKIWLWKDGLSN